MAIDPVSTMEVEEDHEKYRSCSKGKSYYFCSPGCKKKCDDHPDKVTKLVQDIRGMPEPVNDLNLFETGRWEVF